MPAQVMEAPLHQQPLVALPPNTSATATKDMAYHHHGQPRPVNAATAGCEQCPRCSSHDTKFCYYNNYNTSQPRHFCRACRRYWTLGGSLRNVPIGGSTRKRPRPTRPTNRAAAFGPFGAPPAPPQPQSLFGSLINSAPLLALGAAPLLQGRLGFDLGLGLPGPAVESTAGEVGLGFGLRGPAGSPLLWPTGFLEHDHVDTWKHHEPAASTWPELPRAAPAEAGGLHHGAQML